MKKLLALLVSLSLLLSVLPAAAEGETGFQNFNWDPFDSTLYVEDRFTDVEASPWYRDDIASVCALGLMEGTSASTFEPDADVTLGSAMVLACRLHSVYFTGEELKLNGDPWYAPYAEFAKNEGISLPMVLFSIPGAADWESPASRAQCAFLLFKTFDAQGLAPINQVEDGAIPDVPGTLFYSSPIYALYRAGVVVGDENHLFHPEDALTRAELAAMAARMASPSLRQSVQLPPPVEAEKTRITWWCFPGFGWRESEYNTYEQSLADAFVAEHPDVEIEIELLDYATGPDQLDQALISGGLPDLLFDAPPRIMEYARAGELAPLNDLYTEEVLADIGNDSILAACRQGGDYYAFPLSARPYCMAVNKGMWEDSGALQFVNQEGARTWTTANFERALEALYAAGYAPGTLYCGGQGGDQGTRAFITNLFDSSFASADLKRFGFDGEAAVKALEQVKAWVDQGWLGDGRYYVGGDDIELFARGETAFTFCWCPNDDVWRSMADVSGVEVLALPFPSQDGVPALEYNLDCFCVFDSGDPARIAASKAFITFLCGGAQGPANVRRTGNLPVRASFGDLYPSDSDRQLAAGWKSCYGPCTASMPDLPAARVVWWNMLRGLLTGERTAQTSVDYFQTALRGLP